MSSGVIRSALLGGGHIIEGVPTSYIRHVFVVYVVSMSANFPDTVVT